MNKKILLSNKFYYPRGGVENVTIATRNLLEKNGYDVAIFTMDYSKNTHEGKIYTAPEVNFTGGMLDKVQFAMRTLGASGVKKSFLRVLDEFSPDILHLHNIHSYLSPVLAELAHKRGIRVIWTLHDYKLICPSYDCLRQNTPCTLCFDNSFNVVKHHCFKNSISASTLAWIEALYWNRRRIEKNIDAFICPSDFMRTCMIEARFDPNRLHVLRNFVDPKKFSPDERIIPFCERKDYYLYAGRLSHEKGLETLLSAASKLPYILYIAGDGPLKNDLIKRYGSKKNIRFLGQLNSYELKDLFSNARASVVPSEWYENNPLSIIESLCSGTPVIGADIGGIPELLNSSNGIIYPPRDVNALISSISQIMSGKLIFQSYDISTSASVRFSASTHFKHLENIYFQLA